ncbi:MAG: zinc-binding dehydrogenase [Rhizomicrobium sp.]
MLLFRRGPSRAPPIPYLESIVPAATRNLFAIPAVATVKLPPEVDFAAATVVVRHYPQAFNLLRDRAALAAGEWVLVLGASGGLGSACVEVAKLMGAKVIAGAGADDRVAAAIELGADAGVNYRGEDLTAEVMRITDGAGVQVAVDNIGDADIFASTVQAMSRHGRLVTAGSHGGGRVSLDLTRLYLYQLAIMGSLGSKLSDVHASLEALSRHQIKPLIDRIFPLRSAAQAHRLVEARNGIGKIILDPTMP